MRFDDFFGRKGDALRRLFYSGRGAARVSANANCCLVSTNTEIRLAFGESLNGVCFPSSRLSLLVLRAVIAELGPASLFHLLASECLPIPQVVLGNRAVKRRNTNAPYQNWNSNSVGCEPGIFGVCPSTSPRCRENSRRAKEESRGFARSPAGGTKAPEREKRETGS